MESLNAYPRWVNWLYIPLLVTMVFYVVMKCNDFEWGGITQLLQLLLPWMLIVVLIAFGMGVLTKRDFFKRKKIIIRPLMLLFIGSFCFALTLAIGYVSLDQVLGLVILVAAFAMLVALRRIFNRNLGSPLSYYELFILEIIGDNDMCAGQVSRCIPEHPFYPYVYLKNLKGKGFLAEKELDETSHSHGKKIHYRLTPGAKNVMREACRHFKVTSTVICK